MSEYRRTTRACDFEQLRPEIAAAIREYAQRHDVGDVAREARLCCETTSEKLKRGLLGGLLGGDPDPVHHTGAVLTPGWLIWARSGAKYGVTVQAARLRELELESADPKLQLLEQQLGDADSLRVFGFVSGSPQRVSTLIGMGPEPAAREFKDAVRDAIRAAHA